jgi:hypothetical protein
LYLLKPFLFFLFSSLLAPIIDTGAKRELNKENWRQQFISADGRVGGQQFISADVRPAHQV